jgi:hypothetical protein
MITLPRVLSANGIEDATIESLKVSHNRLSSRFDYFERIEVLLIRFELFEIIIDTRKNRDVLITRSFLVRRKHFDSVRHRSPFARVLVGVVLIGSGCLRLCSGGFAAGFAHGEGVAEAMF